MEVSNCKPCNPGYKVSVPCTHDKDTVCTLCPAEQFMPVENAGNTCFRCRHCDRKQIQIRKCTATQDRKCGCPPKMVYSEFKPCKACPKGTVFHNNACHNTTKPTPSLSTVAGGGNGLSPTSIIIATGVASFFLLLAIFIIVLCCYLRKRRRRQQRQNRQEVVHEVVKKPPVTHHVTPPRVPLCTRNENVYSNVPVLPPGQGSPAHHATQTHLTRSSVPFSVVHDMEGVLGRSYQTNYKHLACALGFDSYDFIKKLDNDETPVEKVLDHYFTTKNPTKEGLYQALVSIKRHDVAKMVKDSL